jgi:23S rRNA (adenine2503-C2)-methyltransferase
LQTGFAVVPVMRKEATPDFFGRTQEELAELLRLEFPEEAPFRAAQIYEWLYSRRARTFAEMTNLPRALQRALEERFAIPSLVTQHVSESADGTKKFLFGLTDGRSIETVLIPSEMRGERMPRRTLCVSTQVGCPLDCKFCATASLKLKRNLTTAEILLQIFEVERVTGDAVTNLVFMGMGEPMLNYENLVRALRIITDPKTEMLGARRVTVSTSGIPDAIRNFASEGLNVKLALSLHATTNDLRTRLMPINKRYPLEEVLSAMESYYKTTGRPVTYEYIVFDGLNDTAADAARLAKIARRVPSRVNIIPFHPIDFTHPTGFAAELRPASTAAFDRFIALLRKAGVTALVRTSSGKDIEAACGQLALAELQEKAVVLDIKI